ncbi:MAG: SIS domain-containing protein, partial [Acidobacteria bacterium]|nr:SIS domain-containing protein [Acidobacteriota bacterium]
ISTSGRSKNVTAAMKKARAMGLSCVAFCGATPGPMTELADVSLQIPATRTVLIQEGHIAVGHILCDLVEAAFASDSP